MTHLNHYSRRFICSINSSLYLILFNLFCHETFTPLQVKVGHAVPVS